MSCIHFDRRDNWPGLLKLASPFAFLPIRSQEGCVARSVSLDEIRSAVFGLSGKVRSLIEVVEIRVFEKLSKPERRRKDQRNGLRRKLKLFLCVDL